MTTTRAMLVAMNGPSTRMLELLSLLQTGRAWPATELAERRLPLAARDQLRGIGEATAHQELTHSVSAVVILAQTRSIVVDLIELTGMDYQEARELVPDVD